MPNNSTLLKGNLSFGILYVLIFTLLSSIQTVYLSGLLRHAEVFSTLSLTFMVVTIFFSLFVIIQKALHAKKSMPYTPLKKDKLGVLLINISSAGSWFGFFLALKYLEPAVVSLLANSISPISTLVILTVILHTQPAKKNELISAFGVIASIGFIIVNIYLGNSAVGRIDASTFLVGLIMTIICGLCMCLNTIFSKRLNGKGIEPEQIMSCRFYILIATATLLAGFSNILDTIMNVPLEIIFISFIGNIMPLFLLQVGIKRTPAMTVSLVLTFAPILCLILQMQDHRLVFSIHTAIGIIVTTCFVIYGIIPNHKSEIK